MALDPSHKSRLNWRAMEHFPGDTLFEKIARAVCEAGCLPRKELYESWEVARRVRRRFGKATRILDVAAGHGLLAHIALLLDPSLELALCIDHKKPPSANKIAEAMQRHWPQLEAVEYLEAPFEELPLDDGDFLISSHACGALTDAILDRAIEHRVHVAVLPCCHDLKRCHTGPLTGWLDGPLAVDVMRALRLEEAGFDVLTQHIPPQITPKNRLLLGRPVELMA